MFSWQTFLDQFNISYVTKGPSVTRGHVAVRCPFCVDDPSEHLSISLEGKGWRCWRNPKQHAGKSPTRLIVGLIGCSYDRAKEIAGEDRSHIPNNFIDRVTSLLDTKEERETDRSLEMPIDFKAIRNRTSQLPCINHLRDRGLDDIEIFRLTKRFNLRYCTSGPFKARIIFPVFYKQRLVSYTGRSVLPDAKIRYKTLTADPEKAREMGVKPAVGPINDYLLFYDDLMRSTSETVVVVEGPFDALLMNILGRKLGIVATCIFTNTPTQAQIDLFHEIMPRFRRRCVMLDNDMYAQALRLKSELMSLGVEQVSLPRGVKDPALLRKKQLAKLFL